MNKTFNVTSGQFFFILFTVRLYSLLLNTVSVTDFALYFTVTYTLIIVADLVKYRINKSRILKILLAVLPFILMLQTVLSYVIFIAHAVHPDFSSVLLVILIFLSVIYSASLGTEAIARFSPFCGIVLISALVIAVCVNISAFDNDYLKAAEFSINTDIYNVIKCLDLPLLYVLLSPYVKGNAYKSLRLSVAAAYGCELLLMMFLYCVMGTAISFYDYPAFTLFQMAHIESLIRLDVVFVASLILGLFIKCSILLNVCRLVLRGDNDKKVNTDN